jgi:uncharacterized Zn-binding protein involved in type VI secretion
MPKIVCRVGDVNTGGGVILTGDPTVLIGGRPVAVIGSKVSPHPPCGKPGGQLHCSATTQLLPGTVLVGGKPIATAPSVDTCSHPRLTGAVTVVIGV